MDKNLLPSNFPKNINDIALTGYYGFGNIGDDLILLTALNEYNKAYHLDVRLIANKQPYLEKMLNEFEFKGIPIYNRWDINSIAQAVRYSDALIFGGGGIFQDETSFKSFFYYFFKSFISKLNKRYLIIDRNSIGPINSNLSKFLFKYVVNWAYSISVRDNLSYSYLVNNFPNSKEKFYKREDFVLSNYFDLKDKIYTNIKKERILFIIKPILIKSQNKIIEHPNIFNLEKLIVSIIEEYKDLEISVMTFMYEDIDNLSITSVIENIYENSDIKKEQGLYDSIKITFKNFALYYPGKGNIIDALKYIKESLLVISNRLHGIILAKVFNIPTLAISNSLKIQGIAQDYNIPYMDINSDNLNEKIKEFIKNNLKQ